MKSIIVAYDRNFGIGANNDLLWHLPTDMKHFRETTTGSAIIMGLNTYKSIGRSLPNRQNIVICFPDEMVSTDDVQVVNDLQSAYDCVKDSRDIFVIGGGMIYTLAIDSVDRIIATEVDTAIETATVFFPKFDKNIWHEVSREKHLADENNIYDFDFVEYKKRTG